MKILSYLDYKTLLSVAQVCKKWFDIINNPDTWIKLLKRDKLITDDAVIKYELQYRINYYVNGPRYQKSIQHKFYTRKEK